MIVRNEFSDDKLLKYAYYTLTAVIAAASVAASFYYCFFHVYPVSNDPATWGQLGDYIGGILNPCIGMATIILLVISIRMQKTELRMTREELQNSSIVLEKQSKVMDRQQFESSFFTWLQNYRTAVESISESKDEAYTVTRTITGSTALKKLITDSQLGKSAIHVMYSADPNIQGRVVQSLTTRMPIQIQDIDTYRNRMLYFWHEFYSRNEDYIDMLFRILYRLIKWVDENPKFENKEKWHYVAIARAQISQPEQKILFYNGLTDQGSNFKRLIEKYALFDNLSESDVHIKNLKELGLSDLHRYELSAFSSNEAKRLLSI